MIPRWFERLSITILLLVGVWFRLMDLPQLPQGFSDEELTGITITEQVRDGTVRVFFPVNPSGGQSSFYHMANTGVTMLVGDGLLGYRALGLWANLLALAFLYLAVRSLFGPGIALVTLAIMVSGIWSVLVSRSATPLTLMSVFVTGTLAVMVWAFRLHRPIAPTRPNTTRYTMLGFWVSAAIYTHYTGVLLAIVLLLFVAYLWRTRQPVSRQVWGSSLFTLTLILVLSLPYLISVLRNPRLNDLYVLWRERPTGIQEFGSSLLATLGGLFFQGDANPAHNVPELPLLWPIWFVLAMVGLVVAARRWREPAYGLLLIILGVGVLPDIWLDGGPDFAALMMVQPILFIMASLGAYAAARYVQDNQVMGGWRFVAVLVAMGFGFTVWQTYDRLLIEWPAREDVQVAYHSDVARLTTYLDASLDGRPALICADNIEQSVLPDGSILWAEPKIAGYMLHREDLSLRYAVCRSSFVLINGGESMRVLLTHPHNVNEAAPPIRAWLEQLSPLPDSPPGVVSELDAVEQLAELGGQLQLGPPLEYPRVGSEPEFVTLPVRFGRNIALLGYLPPNEAVYHPGDVLAITTYWRIDGEPPSRLGIFTRLTDTPQASPFTETNVLDVLPTTLQERDVIIQTNFMTIPDALPPGEYILTLGAYDNNPLNQIDVFGEEADEPRGNYLIAGPRLMVEPKEE